MHFPRSRWAELVSEHHTSGLSLEEFGWQHQVSAKALGWWRRRLQPPAASFVEVRVAEFGEPSAAPQPAPPPRLRLELPAGVAIDVPVGLDLAWLRQVVEALS